MWIANAHDEKIALSNDSISNHQFLQSRNRELSFCNSSSWPSGIQLCGHSVSPLTSNANENTRVEMHPVSAKHGRPPKRIHPSVVDVLKHWVRNSWDETLVVGSHGHECRKTWMSEMGMNNNFSKRKSVVIKLIRPLSLEKGVSDSEAANFLDLDWMSKQCTMNNHWLNHCSKGNKKKSCCYQNQETSNELHCDQNQETVDVWPSLLLFPLLMSKWKTSFRW